MSELVLLGDEAVALGALHAGLSGAYGYPGTPSSEILEYLINEAEKTKAFRATWSSNEKTAYEEALGTSFAGKRAIVTMKHVGLNVAADPFMNSALLKINGGLVIVVADDPGMHSSQGEQDSRFFADFAKVPCFEPTNQQEAYEMTREAFDLSEKWKVPVLIRMVTRLAHSRAVIKPWDKIRPQNPVKKTEDTRGWRLLPAIAQKLWIDLLETNKEFASYSENTDFNKLTINPDYKKVGIITTGLGKNYFNENVADMGVKPSHLHIGFYPAPVEKIRKLAESVDKILVIEEGYPVIETKLRGILPQNITIEGKLDGKVPMTGELDPDVVRPALGLEKIATKKVEGLPGRPPQLCQGCPHVDTYEAINLAVKDYPQHIVASDIGCYSLGALPPYNAIETIICMGASIGTAQGAAEAGLKPALAVIGDSTFYHSGLTGLVNAVAANAPITLIILDNSTVAMTGGQATILPSSKLYPLVIGLGADPEHVKTIVPVKKNLEENAAIIKKEMEYDGLSVIISVRECLEEAKRRIKREALKK